MQKIGMLNLCRFRLTIYHDAKARVNPYRIYREWLELDSAGVPRDHRQLIEKYGDLFSCVCHIKDLVAADGKLYDPWGL